MISCDRFVHVVGDLEEMEVVLRDEPELEQIVLEKAQPRLPIAAAGLVHEHHGNDPRLARLHEREHLEAFVHRAEAAGEERHACVSFTKFSLRVKK